MDDPFGTLGLEPALDIDRNTLEARYLELTRACHPDHHGGGLDEAEQIALLDRAARINDAYRLLRDPWRRAEALLELRDPGVIERNKQLDPGFLMEAMELAEEVATAAEGSSAENLTRRLETSIEEDRQRLAAAVADRDHDAAAVALHESRYHRKALNDLRSGDRS
jgi:molecular chaperone HscB